MDLSAVRDAVSAGQSRLPRVPIPTDFGRAAAALVLSCLLYVFAVSQSDAQATWLTTFTVPIQVVNVPSGLVSPDELPPVHLQVRATQPVFGRLTAQSFTAEVDARQARAGDTESFVQVRSTDPGVRDVTAEPPLLILHLEPVHQRILPVQVRLTGQVPAGYQLGRTTTTPEHVTVAGPASLVDQAAEAVVDVNVQAASVSVNGVFTSRVVDANDKNLAQANLQVTPAAVSVEVAITELSQYKEVGVQPVTHGVPGAGYVVQPIEIAPATVTLVGDAASLASARFVQTQPIDISGMTSTVIHATALVAPTGTLLLQPDETVTVTIRVAPLVTTQTLRITAQAINLSSNVLLGRLPGVVALTVTGPEPTLSALAAADVQVDLDLAGKGPGQYLIAPRVHNLPPGITLDSIQPQQVQVILSAAASGAG